MARKRAGEADDNGLRKHYAGDPIGYFVDRITKWVEMLTYMIRMGLQPPDALLEPASEQVRCGDVWASLVLASNDEARQLWDLAEEVSTVLDAHPSHPDAVLHRIRTTIRSVESGATTLTLPTKRTFDDPKFRERCEELVWHPVEELKSLLWSLAAAKVKQADQLDEHGFVTNPPDPTAYVPAQKIINDYFEIVPDIKRLKTLIGRERRVRKYKPNKQRLCIHLVDWISFVESRQEPKQDNPAYIDERKQRIRAARG